MDEDQLFLHRAKPSLAGISEYRRGICGSWSADNGRAGRHLAVPAISAKVFLTLLGHTARMPEEHSLMLPRADQARQAANMAVEHPGQVFLRLVAALMRRPASRMPSCAELASAALGIMLRFVTWWIGAFLR